MTTGGLVAMTLLTEDETGTGHPEDPAPFLPLSQSSPQELISLCPQTRQASLFSSFQEKPGALSCPHSVLTAWESSTKASSAQGPSDVLTPPSFLCGHLAAEGLMSLLTSLPATSVGVSCLTLELLVTELHLGPQCCNSPPVSTNEAHTAP